MLQSRILTGLLLWTALAAGQSVNCDLGGYKAQDGLKAQMRAGALELTWRGERQNNCAPPSRFGTDSRWSRSWPCARAAASWIVLGQNLTPEFELTSGVRRLSEQQMAPLRELGVALTPEVIEREKWNAFWDSPLMVPGDPAPISTCRASRKRSAGPGRLITPRLPGEDRRRAHRSDVPGLRCRHLLRQLAVHRVPRHESAAAGGDRQDRRALRRVQIRRRTEGLRRSTTTRAWSGAIPARGWQQYAFGGAVNQDPVACRRATAWPSWKRRRIARPSCRPRTSSSSSREIETNLGYVYYRKDSDSSLRHRRAPARSRSGATSRGASPTKCGTAASANRAATSTTSRSTMRRPEPCSACPSTST